MIFLDTNILVYAIETRGPTPEKSAIAQSLARRSDVVISTQVLGEFYRATTGVLRASPLTHREAAAWVQLWKRFEIREITVHHVDLALEIANRFQVSYFDAQIIAAARMASCDTIFSEDLSAGQDYGGVWVENPF